MKTKSWDWASAALMLVVVSLVCLGLAYVSGRALFHWLAFGLNLVAFPVMIKAYIEKRRLKAEQKSESLAIPEGASRQVRRQIERRQRKRKA